MGAPSPIYTSNIVFFVQSYSDQRVKQRLKDLLISWATEFKANSKMSPLIKFVEQLRRDGVIIVAQPSPNNTSRQVQCFAGWLSK